MKKWIKVLVVELLVLFWILEFNVSIFISFLWIILHEAAHILVAYKFGCKFNNFNISMMGVNVELMDIDEQSNENKLLIYLAGPCFNIFISLCMLWIYQYYSYDFYHNSMIINLCLGTFNLLPAYPLDGSRIFEILLSKKFLYKKSKKITEIISFVISGVLFLLFNIMLLLHKANITLFLASILMAYTTFLEKEKTMYIIMGDMVKKVRKIKDNNYIDNKSISIYYKKDLVNVLTLVDKNKFNSFYIINGDMRLLGIVHEDELIAALKEYGNISLEEYMKIRKNHQ